MTTVDEAIPASTPIGTPLQRGVQTLSLDQQITFTQYARVALPLDGFVFYVRSGLLASNALTMVLGTLGRPISAANLPGLKTLTAMGSLHYSSRQTQEETATLGINRVVFTSTESIEHFNDIAPGLMYIGAIDDIRFAFAERKSFYRQAELWHYEGDAIYSVMESQIIDDIADLQPDKRVVSNSLPIWLHIFDGAAWPQPYNPRIPIFPSHLVPDNFPPPYAVAHIEPAGTFGMQAMPIIGPGKPSSSQLVKERVKFTLYGVRNDDAIAFRDFILQASIDQSRLFGVMNIPVVRDEKRLQSELNIIANKKAIELDVNYYQTAIYEVTEKYIAKCIPSYFIGTQ